MFIQLLFKNKNYLISNRNYTNDYSRIKSKRIDMTLSGKYLSEYGDLIINMKDFDKYPSIIDIKKLENEIKKQEKTNRTIILGAGANGILHNLVKIFFRKKGNLVTPFYTFNQVEYAVTSFNCITRRVFNSEYKIDFNKMEKAVSKNTNMVYICNPNNPTGIYENPDDIINFSKKVKVPVVVDESGIEFTKRKSLLSYSIIPDNLFVVRSFSKAYGIANFRIGYLVCNSKFKDIYMKNITTNEFSGLSCIVANFLLKEKNRNVMKNVDYINYEKSEMIKKLENIGIECIKSDSNIIMTKSTFSSEFIDILEKNEISVVPIYDEQNDIHIRIAIQDSNTNEEFINILNKILLEEKNKRLIFN